jgi:peptidoglycan/LPS O-acetylase OafA/YrhL
VFVFHSWAFQRSWESETSFEFAKNIIRFGYLSVDVFFILSGYVIIQCAFRQNPKEFLIRRIIRIAPPYFIVSIIEVILIAFNISQNKTQWNNNLLFDQVKNILPISSKDNELRNFVGWSIAVELKFYFIILLVLMVNRYLKKRGGGDKLLYNFSSIWILLIYMSKYFGLEYLKVLVLYDYAPMFIIGLILGKKVLDKSSKIWIELVMISPFVAEHFQGRIAGIGIDVFGIITTIALLIITFLLAKSEIRGNRFTLLLGQSSYPFYLLCGYFGMNLLENIDKDFKVSVITTYVICMVLSIIVNQAATKLATRIL